MPLEFPSSPVDGQVYDNWVYSSSKGAWLAKPLEPTTAVTSDTPPANPIDGDMWFNTVDGTTYVWYDDGNTAQWVEMVAPISANGYYSPNYIINGGFDIWQRGTSSSSGGYSTADRWYAGIGGTVTLSRQSTGAPTGSTYYLRCAMNASSSFCNQYSAFESHTVKQLVGKTVTLSAKFRRNSSFATNVDLKLQKGTDADTLLGGSWTDLAIVTVLNASMPTGTGKSDWFRASLTVTIPNDGTVNGLRVGIAEHAVSASGAYYEIADVQLEEGSVATPFRRNANSLQGELAACQRYYFRFSGGNSFNAYSTGRAASATAFYPFVQYPTEMRTAPSSLEFSNLQWVAPGTGAASISALVIDANTVNKNAVILVATTTGLTAGQIYMLGGNASSYVALSAEL